MEVSFAPRRRSFAAILLWFFLIPDLGEAEAAAVQVLRPDFQLPQIYLGVCFLTLCLVGNIAKW
jgi:hypothetical protein